MKRIIFLTIVFLAFVGCSTSTVVKHPQGMLVTTGDIGGAYQSLGVIQVTKSSPIASSGVASIGAGEFGTRLGKNQSAADEMAAYLNEALVAKAKELGGNAIIKVSYGYAKIPMLIPVIGPFGVTAFSASGEVIKK